MTYIGATADAAYVKAGMDKSLTLPRNLAEGKKPFKGSRHTMRKMIKPMFIRSWNVSRKPAHNPKIATKSFEHNTT